VRPRGSLALAVALVSAGCGTGADERSDGVTVLAASSLTESFSEVGRRFEAANPRALVAFGFDAA
jgi:molybdate transport system substrate-binding protein